MESLKGWLSGIRKPLQRMSEPQTQTQTQTKAVEKADLVPNGRQLPRPVPAWLQPIPRPIYDVPTDGSTDISSLSVRKRRAIIPQKRPLRPDQRSDDLIAKRPRLQEKAPVLTLKCHEDADGYGASEAASGATKRRRTDSSADQSMTPRPTKKAKTTAPDDATLPDDGEQHNLEDSAEHVIEQSALHDLTSHEYGSAFLNSTSHNASDSQQSSQTSHSSVLLGSRPELGMSIRALKSRAPTALRNAAKKYVRSKLSAEEKDSRRISGVPGIGLWPGSSAIPGARKDAVDDKYPIRLPVQKPGRVVQNEAVVVDESLRSCRALASVIELPKLFEPQIEKRQTFTKLAELRQISRKIANPMKKQRRLVSLWDRSVGLPMGPTEWTG